MIWFCTALVLISGTATPVSVQGNPDNRATQIGSLEQGTAEVRSLLEPVGTVIALATNNIPAGWLPCDGQTLKASEYPALAAVLGTAGETFQLPDLRGTFLRGAGEGRAPLTVQGQATAMPAQPWVIIVAESGAHNHGVEDGGGRLVTFRQVAGRAAGNGNNTPSGLDRTNGEINCSWPTTRSFSIDRVGDHTHTTSMAGGDPETRPENAAVRFVIKAALPTAESTGAATLEERIRQVAFSLAESERHLCPSGTLITYGGNKVSPGWLAVDGGTLPREQHRSLAALLAPSGSGDTFALPDLRGLFLRGANEGRSLLSRQGSATAMPASVWTVTLAPAGSHNHGIDGGGGHLVISDGNSTVSGTDGHGNEFSHDWARCRGVSIATAGEHTHGASMAGGDPETRPTNVAVVYLVNAWESGTKAETSILGSDPVTATKLARLTHQLEDLRARITPSGTIIAYAGASVPAGWLVCDGRSAKSRDCPALAAALSASSDTFQLPDLRGMFLRGAADGRAELSTQAQATAMPAKGWQVSVAAAGRHSHAFNCGGSRLVTFNQVRDRSVPNGDCTPCGLDGHGNEIDCFWPDCPPITVAAVGNHTHATTVGGGDAETRPANTAVQYLIKK